MVDYEKLGVFYLGRKHEVAQDKTLEELILYDSKDFTTHAVCVGMTGSGKTGLCIVMLEEAAIDGIPAIIIDPKGDMTNLLLNFPNMDAEDFIPWISATEASKANLSVEEYAKEQAKIWRSGLEKWNQGSDRLARLKNAAEINIFTPGSSSGLPISILKSFAAPPKEILEDADTLREKISTTATSLLTLLGIDADPITSREHILLSTVFSYYWEKNQDLTLSNLIYAIQSPPISRIGVLNLDSFYPAKERFEFALKLNNLLAAPGFQTWLEGDSLDVNELLYSKTGKPRMSIIYIAHLSEAERMFIVSLLLNEVLSWIRTQPGCTSLRALLYFDEIFGYIPPIANPPSKKPLLTLLKQARAFGLGIVLATQNPVDLDYKGLSNIGTWFIGRLQTERDRDRVLDGLLSASNISNLSDKKSLETAIAGLGKRKFLLHNVHDAEPVVFATRWAMSYLCGPLTRIQIKKLVGTKPQKSATDIPSSPKAENANLSLLQEKPMIEEGVTEVYLPIRIEKPPKASLIYRSYLWCSSKIHFINAKHKIDIKKSVKFVVPITQEVVAIDLERNVSVDLDESALLKQPENAASFDAVAPAALKAKSHSNWNTDFRNFLSRNYYIELYSSQTFNEYSFPNESERDFRIRLSNIAREHRDEWIEKLRKKYQKKVSSLERKIRNAQIKLEKEQKQAQHQKLQTAMSIGTTLLGAFLGRKAISHSTMSRAGTALRSTRQVMKEASDVKYAEETIFILQQELDKLQDQFQEEISLYSEKTDALSEKLEKIRIYPNKSDIEITFFSFAWIPFWSTPNDGLLCASNLPIT